MNNQTQADNSPLSYVAEQAFLAFHDQTPDGFMMFTPIRNETGEITDLEWTFVNKAAGDIVGRVPAELMGKRLLEEMPANRDEGLFDAYVSVIETGKTWHNEFQYSEGDIEGWFRTTAAKSGEGLALSFADITELRKGDERLKALIDGVLAFVGVLSLDGILLEANEPAVQAAGGIREELIGRPFWDCFWWDVNDATKDRLKMAVADAAKGKRVRYDAEIQVVGGQRMWIDFQIAPVFNGSGDVVELIPSGVDISERKATEAHRELLFKELSHRVKNTLATVQSIAGQTARGAGSMSDFRQAFAARLQSIAASHDLLVKFDHRKVPLTALLRGQVRPYTAREQSLSLKGEDILLPGDAAHSLGLILHELATNASKYGALSTEEGQVEVTWLCVYEHPFRKLHLTWAESNGPPVQEPTRQGFGTTLIKRSLSSTEENAEIEYPPGGIRCTLELVLE